MIRWFQRRIGRRGGVLLFISTLDLIFAFSLIKLQNPVTVKVYGDLVPLDAWAWVWIAAGVAAFSSAFVRFDAAGFTLSALILTFWGWLAVVGWINGTNPNGWVTASFFLVLDGLIIIPATWPEPRELISVPIDENHPDAIVTADDHGVITGWLGAAQKLFGWTADEVLGHPITMIMPIKYRNVHDNGVVRVRETGRSDLAGKPLKAEGLHRDGSEFPVIVVIGVHHTSDGIVFSTTISRRPV